MNTQITFRGMEHSNAIEEYVKQALEKPCSLLEKEPEPIQIEVILEAHRQHHHHKVEIRIHSKHNHFIVEHEGPDLYLEIDQVMKVLTADIKKQKSKYLDKRNHKPETLNGLAPDNETIDEE